jgi:ribosomal protein S11
MIQKKVKNKLKKSLKKNKFTKFKTRSLISKFFRKNKKLNNLVKELYIKNVYSFVINIKMTPNNIFCVLKDRKSNKTLLLITGGILKFNITKKKLKFLNKKVIGKFLTLAKKNIDIRKKLDMKSVIVNLSVPKKYRKQIIRLIIKSLYSLKFIFQVEDKKCFNGCRPRKQRRKKRKGLRILK